MDWTDPDTWKRHKTVDLACGSGTLLAAMLADMKRRAREQDASAAQLADLQKLTVEETLKGLDINPVSLQLAASQLTTGNQEIRYRKMGLHLMPYGPQADNPAQVSAGTLELLGQKAIVPRDDELGLADDKISSQAVWNQLDAAELEDAVDAVKDARIVIMNPPFSNRSKMGEKFPEAIQQALRKRTDGLEYLLTNYDPELKNFGSRNTVRPCFVTLADRCLPRDAGTLTMINPTIALSAPSGLNERRILAERYHIHTILTGRWPREFTLSQNTEIDESIVVATRKGHDNVPTRFVHLDKMPADESEVDDLYQCLSECEEGQISNGWGEVSWWPAERIMSGDWTPAIWRSPELAQAGYAYASGEDMRRIQQEDIYQAGRRVSEFCHEASVGDHDSFALLHSKGADGQTSIAATPDRVYKPKDQSSERCLQGVKNLKARAGHLLITDGQDSKTGRLTAVASDTKYVGVGWMPVAGFSTEESKGIAVFLNSTPGRLQLMRNAGRKLAFPMYRPVAYANIRIPNIKDARIRQTLADCWERTKDMTVPQFRDGECDVRRLWDEAVADAVSWDPDELARLRNLLHQEPHVRGLGYNQYGDAVDIEPADRERFRQLADQWEMGNRVPVELGPGRCAPGPPRNRQYGRTCRAADSGKDAVARGATGSTPYTQSPTPTPCNRLTAATLKRCRRPGWNGVRAMDTHRWAQLLITAFPKLSDEDFEIVEPASERYNCIAYAAADATRRWWPNEIDYWPSWATRDNRDGKLNGSIRRPGIRTMRQQQYRRRLPKGRSVRLPRPI